MTSTGRAPNAGSNYGANFDEDFTAGLYAGHRVKEASNLFTNTEGSACVDDWARLVREEVTKSSRPDGTGTSCDASRLSGLLDAPRSWKSNAHGSDVLDRHMSDLDFSKGILDSSANPRFCEGMGTVLVPSTSPPSCSAWNGCRYQTILNGVNSLIMIPALAAVGCSQYILHQRQKSQKTAAATSKRPTA